MLLDALSPTASEEAAAQALEKVAELQGRDEIFPDILESVESVLKQG